MEKNCIRCGVEYGLGDDGNFRISNGPVFWDNKVYGNCKHTFCTSCLLIMLWDRIDDCPSCGESIEYFLRQKIGLGK